MPPFRRVADPSALDACQGARVRLGLDVPAAWLAEGVEIAITAPSRLACARCEGGGCDGCARSGALRAPEDRAARVVLARLPAGSGPAIALRIPAPFGPDHAIAQLGVELRAGAAASEHVRRVDPPRVEAPRLPALSPGAIVAAMVALAAIVAALLGRG